MIARWRGRIREEGGFTLVEMSVALILSAMVVGTFVSVFFSFSQNAGDTTAKAEHQEMSRQIVASLVVDLRQAVRAEANGYPIESLAPDRLVFYTISRDATEPVRVIYERIGCVEGECTLQVSRFAAVGFEDGDYEFSGAAFEQHALMRGVLADQPLFGGFDWVGDPKVKTTIVSCGSGADCDFPLVSIALRARPFGTSAGARTTLEIREEVRLRNA